MNKKFQSLNATLIVLIISL